MELLRGTMLRHSLIVYRDNAPVFPMSAFDGDNWLDYIPVQFPETNCVEEKIPPGAAGVLINQNHTDKDSYLTINTAKKRMFIAIDKKRTIGNIIETT